MSVEQAFTALCARLRVAREARACLRSAQTQQARDMLTVDYARAVDDLVEHLAVLEDAGALEDFREFLRLTFGGRV